MANVDDERIRRDGILLVEYQKAQDSAEHHDKLLWTALGLIVTGMVGIFFFAVSHPPHKHSIKTTLVSILGIILSFLLCFITRSFASFRNEKYKRCKEIELELGMKQHRNSCSGNQRKVVYFLTLLSGLSFIAWLLWTVS